MNLQRNTTNRRERGVCVCVCVCVCINQYMNTNVYPYVYVQVYRYVCMFVCIQISVFILRNWLVSQYQASLISVGQASRLETQVRVYIAVLSSKAGNSARISMLLFGGKIPSFWGNFSLGF